MNISGTSPQISGLFTNQKPKYSPIGSEQSSPIKTSPDRSANRKSISRHSRQLSDEKFWQTSDKDAMLEVIQRELAQANAQRQDLYE